MPTDRANEIKVERQGNVALVEIDRPPLNFFDRTLVSDLADRLHELDADSHCRCVVLAASGKVFCAGADLGTGVDPLEAAAEARRLYQTAIRILETDTPVVAAVHGAAIGGGLGLALAADFRIAAPTARFSANFARIGMHCGFGISATLPRAVGQTNAAMLLFTGRRIDGAEAVRIGLCQALAQDARAGAMALAEEIAGSAPRAVRDMRHTLRSNLAGEVRAAMERELSCQEEHMQTADFAEGVRAVAEQRVPVFSGR